MEWCIPPKSTVLLFVGKFEEKKRPLDFLQALKKVLQMEIPKDSIHGLMVGDGPLRKLCEDFAKQNALPVSFTGFLNQTEIPKAYVAADVLILPSDGRETWGIVVNEAMVCGVPAIVSDRVGCGPDLVRPHETGFIFPCGDTSSLAKAIYPMMTESLASSIGQSARTHVARYSVESAASAVVQAVQLVSRKNEYA